MSYPNSVDSLLIFLLFFCATGVSTVLLGVSGALLSVVVGGVALDQLFKRQRRRDQYNSPAAQEQRLAEQGVAAADLVKAELEIAEREFVKADRSK